MEDLTDDIVGLVLLRLDSPVSLLRAASTCRRWRRIISDAVFLRCFRSLHEPPIAGYYYNHFLSPRFEPSSSSSSPINDSRYSLDFLPKDYAPGRWTIKDSQGSLLLMVRSYFFGTRLAYMVVCEPLTRSYEVMPLWKADWFHKQFFLLDAAAAGGMISTSNFRVLCVARGYFDRQIHADVFTAGSSSWRQIRIDDRVKKMRFIGRAAGSLYWHCGGLTVTSLDQSAAGTEFISSFLFPNADGVRPEELITVATGGDGEARIFLGGAGGIIKVFASAGGEWTLEKSVQLSPALFGLKTLEKYWYFGCGSDLGVHGRGKVMIVVYREQSYVKGTRTFSFDIDKLEAAERLQDTPYPVKLPWPPSLHACTDLVMVACVKKGRKRRKNNFCQKKKRKIEN